METDAIKWFTGENRWLSNFYWVDVSYDGEVYPSTEHAYQASKTLDKDERIKVKNARTFTESKRLGYKVPLREDWEEVKLGVMFDLVYQKFNENNHLKKLLLGTGDKILFEMNTWGDLYWGVDLSGKGENKLGIILMNVRKRLREQENT